MRAGNRHEATRNSGVFKIFGFALCALLFAFSGPVGARQREKIAKIGEFDLRGDSTLGTGRKLFRQSLRELGYIEGKNVIYETRSAEGNLDRFSALGEELVRLKKVTRVAVLWHSSGGQRTQWKAS